VTERQQPEEQAGPRGRSRLLLPVIGSLVAVGILFVGIFPTRALLEQRRELSRAEASLAFIEARNDELEQRVEALGTDAEVERIAREQYNLGRPGEEVYAILPAPPAPPAVPDAWPFRGLHDAVATAAP
jgi:cell division protein FtsB